MNDLSAFDGDAERDRQIVDLRVKGKSEAEVCQILGCTVPDIHRAIWRLARRAESGGPFPPYPSLFYRGGGHIRVSLELNRSRQQQQRARAQLSLKKVS